MAVGARAHAVDVGGHRIRFTEGYLDQGGVPGSDLPRGLDGKRHFHLEAACVLQDHHRHPGQHEVSQVRHPPHHHTVLGSAQHRVLKILAAHLRHGLGLGIGGFGGRRRHLGHLEIPRRHHLPRGETAAGIYRDGPTLTKAVEQLRVLQERFANVGIDDHSHTFNTELLALLELSGMLDVAQTIIESALRREESRGAHQQPTLPCDDEHFLAHTLIHREPDGTARIDYVPVTITRWPPGERVYGR